MDTFAVVLFIKFLEFCFCFGGVVGWNLFLLLLLQYEMWEP